MNNELLKVLESKLSLIKNGFKKIKISAEEIFFNNSLSDSLVISNELYSSKIYQVRMVAVFLFGFLAKNYSEAFNTMCTKVIKDDSWQVQEILAQSVDRFCKDIGYKKSLPLIRKLLSDPKANCRRAVSEGLRIWTSRDYFKDYPEVAINLLSKLRNDDSDYVRKSAGNALRDISKGYKYLVLDEFRKWDLNNKKVKQVYELASRFI